MVLSVDEQVLMAAVEKFEDFECSHGNVDWVRCAAIGVDLAWVPVYKIPLRMEPILSIDSDKLFLNVLNVIGALQYLKLKEIL